MLRQPDKATLVAFGVPDVVINEELDLSKLKDSITKTESKRVSSAAKDKFYVYPRATGQYIVCSVKEGEITETYNINLNSNAACSCEDFLYNCSPNGISCKHIWRIRFLIKLDCLPRKTADPYPWLVSEIYRDLNWLRKQNVNTEESEKKMSQLLSTITKLGPYNMNYRILMRNRAYILMMSESYTMV